MIIGAFIIDLLLLVPDIICRPVLSDNLNAGSRTIAFQQSLFLNAFALIEFFQSRTTPDFCPNVAELRPFTIQDRRPLLESSPELVKQFDRLWA